MHESQFLSAFVLRYRNSEISPHNEERESEMAPIDVMHQIEQILPELVEGDLKTLLNPCTVLVLAGYRPETILYKDYLHTPVEVCAKHKIDVLHESPISLIAARNRLRESKLLQMILTNIAVEMPMNIGQLDELGETIAVELRKMFGEHKHIAHIIYEGIILGYPDQAILDFVVAYYKDYQRGLSFEHRDKLVPAGIVDGNDNLEYLSEHYVVPDFDVAPEHVNDPSVVSASTRQRDFLEEFYSLPQVIAMLESVGIRKSRT